MPDVHCIVSDHNKQYSRNKTKQKQLRIKQLKRILGAIAVRKIPVLSPVNA